MAVLPLFAVAAFGIGIPLLQYALSRRSPAAGEVVHLVTDEGVTSSGTGWGAHHPVVRDHGCR
jgi:hypothetical protein